MKFSDNILDFLNRPYPMVLGTVNKNGRPQATIVWFEYEDGIFKISTTKDRLKYKNIVQNPYIAFVIYNPENAFNYLQVQGKVTDIVEDEDYRFKKRLTVRYAGKDRPAYTERDEKGRVIISITPERYTWTAKTLL